MQNKKEAIFSGDFRKHYTTLPYRSVVTIPMLSSGEIFGFVTIMHKESAFFSFSQFNLLESLVRHSALALTNTVLKDQLEDAVITDFLTKLYSRSYLDELIDMHMKVDDKGTLVLFDIDDFKKIMMHTDIL